MNNNCETEYKFYIYFRKTGGEYKKTAEFEMNDENKERICEQIAYILSSLRLGGFEVKLIQSVVSEWPGTKLF